MNAFARVAAIAAMSALATVGYAQSTSSPGATSSGSGSQPGAATSQGATPGSSATTQGTTPGSSATTPGAGGSMTSPGTGGSMTQPGSSGTSPAATSSQGGTGANDQWMREDCSKAANRTACEQAFDKCQAMAGDERSACLRENAPEGVRG